MCSVCDSCWASWLIRVFSAAEADRSASWLDFWKKKYNTAYLVCSFVGFDTVGIWFKEIVRQIWAAKVVFPLPAFAVIQRREEVCFLNQEIYICFLQTQEQEFLERLKIWEIKYSWFIEVSLAKETLAVSVVNALVFRGASRYLPIQSAYFRWSIHFRISELLTAFRINISCLSRRSAFSFPSP